MPVIADIKEQLYDLTTFKHIAAAFTEAAAVKLRNIRSQFTKNARFYNEITYLYHLVEVNAKRDNVTMNSQNTPSPQIPKLLSVALTSNRRFFGALNNEIIETFLASSQKDRSERLVIGKTGLDYLRSAQYQGKYEKLVFKTDLPDSQEIGEFLKLADVCDRVLVYYPKFISFLKQTVGVADITQKIISKEKEGVEETSMIFEPELSKIVKFFEAEVRLILFKNVLLETDLARTAARLLTMNQAEERTDMEINAKEGELRKVLISNTNMRLLDTFSGFKKWKSKRDLIA